MWIFLVIIMLPWAAILSKCDVLKKIIGFFENLIRPGEQEGETSKKNGLFY